jgi:hypothetical protein
MVGLFGTVFGMIKAFNGIVIAGGQPQPAHLAGGISIALVTTFWGLLVAIPALAVHGIFRHRIETLASQAAIEAQFVLSEMTSSLGGRDREEDIAHPLSSVQDGKLRTRLEIRSYKVQTKEPKPEVQKSSLRSNDNL